MKRYFPFVFSGFLLIVDQVIKYGIQKTKPNSALFLYHENYGFLGNIPAPYWFILVVMALFLLILVHFLVKAVKNNESGVAVGLSFMIAGALGNFVDRIQFGFVVDYIRIWTSIFNLADVMIVVGVAVIILNSFFKKQKNH